MYSSDKKSPFTTTNAILAYCLNLAGIPFENDARPCRVIYSEEIIKKFVNGSGEPIYKGWELDKATEDAWKKGRRGHIEYAFDQAPNLSKLLKVYRHQVEQLETATGFAWELLADIDKEVSEGTIEQDVAIVRRTCVILKMRLQFMSMWEKVEPIVMIAKAGDVQRRREVIQTKHGAREALVFDHPGYIGISLYASQETKDALGI